jgi:hypothetical protein
MNHVLVTPRFPLIIAISLWLSAASAATNESIRVYSHLLVPREHPDYARRAVKPPDWDTFGRLTQFTCLRGFGVQNERITGFAEELEKYTRKFQLGDVIWPSYEILFGKNLGELANEIKSRNLYLFDIWGYVPGSGPGGYWQQFKPPAEAFTILETTLGERWLGTDIGEQDGRYIGGYANQMTPASADHVGQYLNFQRHFERMSDDLGHKHSTLVSLNFGHYFLKEGTYTLIGAETAQGLPNNQVYYAFIRGAGKQYGVPWFGNASIFNRWGYKTYGSSGKSDGYEHGPTKGTSLSLLKRLLYTHVAYNSVAVGFENGWFDGENLSPIGRIQQSAQRWVKEHGQPGVMHTPVALLLDFYSGWSFPRHLYTDKLYRVWGNLPYGPGDFQTDAVLNLLYPGYADSSYFHDETGFITATPYGDIADCLLTDAPLWVLERYPVLVIAGELRGGRELQDKLEAYIAGGGHLVLVAGELQKFPNGIAGVKRVPSFRDGSEQLTLVDPVNGLPLQVLPLRHPPTAETPVQTPDAKQPLVVSDVYGKGRVTVLATRSVIGGEREIAGPARSEVDKPLISPAQMATYARAELDRIFRSQELFEVDPHLAVITCRKGPGEYTIFVLNNSWEELPLELRSRCGGISSMKELPLDESEKSAVGYLPESVNGGHLGKGSDKTIAGGDVRIFSVHVNESGVEEMAHKSPAGKSKGLLLPLRSPQSLKEEILKRPTFFERFDGVLVDWRYLHEREPEALRGEAPWIKRQGLKVAVDLSSGINLYPTLRLIDNVHADYLSSLAAISNVMAKMEIVGARDLVFSLHRYPENNFTDQQTRAAFEASLKTLATEAKARDITLHLRQAFGKPPSGLSEAADLLKRIGASNLRLAPSTAMLVASGRHPAEAGATIRELGGLWLVSAPGKDLTGHLYDAHRRLHGAPDLAQIQEWLKAAPELPLALDGIYADSDQEYLDAAALRTAY